MEQSIGLDVFMKETAISIRQDGKRIWRGKCVSDPQLLAAVIRKRAPHAQRVVFETGPLLVWFFHALTAVKRGKNDAVDAEALCGAMSRPTMRFVPVKTADQQAVLMLMGVRD